MSKIASISVKKVFDFYGSIQADVFLSEERIRHIKDHHPSDFDSYGQYISDAIEDPDIILNDNRSTYTAMFIKKVGDSGLNVIVKLSLATNERSFVITMYAVGSKSINKLEKNFDIVYKASS